ncbi:pyridoxamine 5'-phosphate oxidase [Apibacter raozihei]|uniref:pyridoxamine 5'-phosphate oxidase n=1 Tax=Apibacter raozihei TaxID=2500547 RepID=UPI000FE317C8|nr:pyridoxamine 5'-phosphate oxidase [Apibacter raozihei]
MEDLSDKRKVYNSGYLLESELKENPIEMFRDWYFMAENSSLISEPNAMCITTIENNLIPRSRMVLLKQFTWEGFIFYTNYLSRKGKAILENTQVCLHFFWDVLEKQIIINGKAEKLAENLSDGYFHSRPRGSQLGAMASPQSKVIPNREYLENKLSDLDNSTKHLEELTRPENWGGYLIKPTQIEFWQGRPNRLHDRIIYELNTDGEWVVSRLAP